MKTRVVVFTENEMELKMYFEMFTSMLIDKTIKTAKQKDFGVIETDTHIIRFYLKRSNQRGVRADYALNLTQDIEFENYIAKPCTASSSFRKKVE